MPISAPEKKSPEHSEFDTRDIVKLLLVAFVFVLLSTLILENRVLRSFSGDIAQLQAGDIAPQDIIASNQLSYESTSATDAARAQAESQIPVYYSRPDAEVARLQQATAVQVLSYLDAVRADGNLDVTQKLDWIEQIQPISFSREDAADILNLSDTLWLDAKQEVQTVLDDAMRTEIRESQLSSVRRRLDLLISPSVPQNEANVVINIVEDLVQPNTFEDVDRTKQARQEARDSVTPVYNTLAKNEVIVRQGERLSTESIEALQALGLQTRINPWLELLQTALWLTILVTLLAYYLKEYHVDLLRDNQQVILLTLMLLGFMVGVGATLPDYPIIAYALPVTALTITVASVMDTRLALMVTVFMALVTSYMADGSLEWLTYVLVSGFVVALLVGQLKQISTLLWAGLYTALSNVIIIWTFAFLSDKFDLVDILANSGAGLLSGVLSAGTTLLILFAVGSLTDMVTYLQLAELSRPTHPLLTELLQRAPGTYHHSLLVGNLAEQAAERIGANATLCRVGAYYHDVGKIMRPYFFTENTPPGGVNLHEPLEPEVSAGIIIDHVTDGLKLAKKYHLPKVILNCISEHHGTELVSYFYRQAKDAVGGDETLVNKADFTYPGPKPQSKETAILMLADASEATVRSIQPHNSNEIDEIIDRTIASRMKSGQFDECDLTLQDLKKIKASFSGVLKGVSHPRIKYPEDKKEMKPAQSVPPLPLAMQSPQAPNADSDAGIQPSQYSVQRE